jgi:hemolysin D
VSLRVAEKKDDLRVVRQYRSEIAEIRESAPPRSAQFTVHALAAFLVGILVVCAFGRTDRVVESIDGVIVPKESPIVVQAYDPGVIRSIDVKAGEKVSKGQLLATLDPTFTQSLVDQYRAQVHGLTTQIARDEAEIAQKPLVFPPVSDPDFTHYADINRALYNQQMANFNAQLASFDQQIALTRATVAKLQADQARLKERVDIQSQIEGMYSTLEKHGTGSLLNSLNASATRIDAARTMEYDENSVKENEHQLAVLQANREAFLQQFLSTASQDLATAKVNLDTAQAQLDSAQKRRELVRFAAPEDAQVLSVANVSVGSILQAGNALFTLTPLSVPLEVEIKLSPATVGFVRVGDPVEIGIDTFNATEHGVVEGVVRWISEDIVDPNHPLATNNGATPAGVVLSQSGQGNLTNAYYTARVTIGKIDLHGMPPTFRFTPGMTLHADIKVGTHSIADYLLGAISRGTTESMREP